MAEIPDNLKPENLSSELTPFLQKFGWDETRNLWDRHLAPFDLLKIVGGPIAYRIIKSSVDQRFRNVSDDIKEIFS